MANNQILGENFKLINRYAMQYGLLLGLFWVVRYLFHVVAGIGVSDRFDFIYYLLNIATLLVVYIFYYKFKTSDADNPKNIWQCILFTTLMCFYASFFEGAMIFAHYQFIDPAYFTKITEPFLKSVDVVPRMWGSEADYEETKQFARILYSNKLFYIAIEFIKNIFLGLFLSLILNFVVKVNNNK
ncbi:MAG: DUF4199 domain-containing protein [Prevotella sp.]|jgi:hypothetical protein|nr:DUF4199 domain-containing protein [Prevotella sp.]